MFAATAASAASCSLVTSFDGYVGPSDASTPSDSSLGNGNEAADSPLVPEADAQSRDTATGDEPDSIAMAPDGRASDASTGDAAKGDGALDDAFAQEGGADSPTTSIAFVQASAATPAGAVATAAVTFDQAQNSGDLVVVAVGWTGSAGVTKVSDSSGNTYASGVGPTQISAGLAQAIYYSRAVAAAAAGANTVTASFTASVGPVEIVAAEYSGLDAAAPFDTGNGFGGRGPTASSGNATTAAAPELVFGAGFTKGMFTGASSGFTLRQLATGGIGILEDRVAPSAGAYSADAPLAASAYYIMQVAAFR